MLWVATHGNGTYRTDLVPVSTPVEEVANDMIAQTRVFPNPFQINTILELSMEDESLVTISIYNMSGNLMEEIISGKSLRPGLHTFEIDGHNWPSGSYVINVSAGTHERAILFLKN